MSTVSFPLADVIRVIRAHKRVGPHLIIRRGRCNGVFVWLSADEYFRRLLSSNLDKQCKSV